MNEKRTVPRFPFKSPLNYMAMGYPSHTPDRNYEAGELVDLSDKGMRMKIEGRKIEEGAVLLVRVPVSGPPVSVPSLAQVLWTREQNSGDYESGLRFVIA
jgi:PilZ domain